jgi:hypothetical protein
MPLLRRGVRAIHIWNLVEIVIVYRRVMDRPSALAQSMNIRRGTKNRSHLQLLAISLSSSTNEYAEWQCRRMLTALAFTVDNHEQADGVERLIGWPTVKLREFVSLTRMSSRSPILKVRHAKTSAASDPAA